MRIRSWSTTAVAMVALSVGLWSSNPAPTRANGEKHEDTGGHAHVPAPLEYADVHVPLSVWTDAAVIARGKGAAALVHERHQLLDDVILVVPERG